MNKFVGLLIVVGLVAVAYVNRDKIAALRSGSQETAAEEQPAAVRGPDGEVIPPAPEASPGAPAGPGTPHPAKEAQAQAARLYPGLLIPGSPFNKRFLALHTEAQRSEPELLAKPDWPLTLAERTMVALGGSPLPRVAPVAVQTPKPLPGSALDAKPKK